MNFQQIQGIDQLQREYKELSQNPISNIGVSVGLVDEGNIYKWRATLTGPKDTSYKGGIFILIITFPMDYPNHPPEVCFRTPIYHVNVNPQKPTFPGAEGLGHVCISTLNWWKPQYKMKEVLTNIFGLFYMANPDSPYGLDRANEFKNNRALYEEKAKYFTEKYASFKHCSIEKEYTESWDFTFN